MGSHKHKKKYTSEPSSSEDSSSEDERKKKKKHSKKPRHSSPVDSDSGQSKRGKSPGGSGDERSIRKHLRTDTMKGKHHEQRQKVHHEEKTSSKVSLHKTEHTERGRSRSRSRQKDENNSRKDYHRHAERDREKLDRNRKGESQSQDRRNDDREKKSYDRRRDGSREINENREQRDRHDDRARDPSRENYDRRERNDRDRRNDRRNRGRRSSSYDHANAKWGKSDDPAKTNKNESGLKEKDKPNFGLSGKLTEERNTYKGVVIKYSEPPEARKPRRRWRLYPFKGEKALQTLYIHRESAYLIGRERKVVDLPVDHPSCSKQHAALQYRLVPFTRDDGSAGKRVRPYIIDLESANGTFINNKKIDSKKYIELFERDVIKFGFSSREYVLLHENSKDEAMDDDVKQEPEEDVKVKVENET
ncbi:unnamed protein product [Phaedon cochleariae]|uniref:FHA domain-containing protein n=1 Tax=Phaedon cochleariae TaxID=80249 RepID=A0A9P0DSG2_PHACE|nr:unnamed protein product [Phaedon cochleariae]